jgi:taurine dioxygenase
MAFGLSMIFPARGFPHTGSSPVSATIVAYGGGHLWHSDISYLPRPSLGALFYCPECPPAGAGGGTSFAGMFAAYEQLPPEQRQWLEQQTAIHDYVWHYETYLTHPVSGRQAIYVSAGLTKQFDGMGFEESRRIIEEITDFATQDRWVYTHLWRPGDLVFRDNRSTTHRAEPFDMERHRRLMHRTTIKGDEPFYENVNINRRL